MTSITHAVDRILAIDWKANYSHLRSGNLLCREYLRRMAIWAGGLGVSDLWPFFDLVELIDDSVKIPDQVMASLRQHFLAHRLFGGMRVKVCQQYVRWELASSLETILDWGPPSPYEPLIVMFERGTWPSSEAGQILINETAGFRMGMLEEHLSASQLVELHSETLDRIDREAVGEGGDLRGEI